MLVGVALLGGVDERFVVLRCSTEGVERFLPDLQVVGGAFRAGTEEQSQLRAADAHGVKAHGCEIDDRGDIEGTDVGSLSGNAAESDEGVNRQADAQQADDAEGVDEFPGDGEVAD